VVLTAVPSYDFEIVVEIISLNEAQSLSVYLYVGIISKDILVEV
jgi:hypothetical protein